MLPKEAPPNAAAVWVAAGGVGPPKPPRAGAPPNAGTAAELAPKANPAVVPPPNAKLPPDPGVEAPKTGAELPNTAEVVGPPKPVLLPLKGDALLPKLSIPGTELRPFSLFGEDISTLACVPMLCPLNDSSVLRAICTQTVTCCQDHMD